MAKILIIDDDKLNTQIYATKLQAEGHEVDLCFDGSEASEKIKNQYNFILLDYMVPKFNGLELLTQIKQGININTPVIVYTNLINDKVKQDCLKAGAKEFLLKVDLNPNLLLDKIRSNI